MVAALAPAVLLAALLLLVTPQQIAHTPGARPLDAAGYALIAGASLALALRPWLPLAAYAGSLLLTAIYLLTGHPAGPLFIAPLAALLFLVGRVRLTVWVPAALLGAIVLGLVHLATGGSPLATAIWMGVWLLVAALVAAGLRVRSRFAAEAQARAEWARRTQDEEARRRLAEERLGIAREMHDVVGHSLAVISLQAGVAEHLLKTRPDEALKAVGAIRQVSRQALNELRAELAVLRGDRQAERAPAPDLGRLPDLINSMREAGLSVELVNGMDRAAVPDIVGGAAYRIVQESLTNVARHAGPGAHAVVRLGRTDEAVELEVTDDGAGAHDSAPSGAGLRGMAERVAALGGRLDAGNRPEGGFRVHAVLPWSPA